MSYSRRAGLSDSPPCDGGGSGGGGGGERPYILETMHSYTLPM